MGMPFSTKKSNGPSSAIHMVDVNTMEAHKPWIKDLSSRDWSVPTHQPGNCGIEIAAETGGQTVWKKNKLNLLRHWSLRTVREAR